MIRTIATILSILCLVPPLVSVAQQYEFGISGVGTGYMGDINNSNPLYYRNIGGGAFVKYNLNSTWGFRGAFNYLPIYGNDMDFPEGHHLSRGLLFNNNLKEFSVTAEFNFFKFIPGRQTNRYSPYILAGVAGISHSPYAYYQGNKVDLTQPHLEVDKDGLPVNFSTWAFSIPIGVGFKYNIRGPWSIGAEINYRTVLSDHIDAVSQYYRTNATGMNEGEAVMADPMDPTGNLSERAGTLRGDGKRLDGYMTAGFTLTYTLISKKCEWWQ